MTTRLVTSRGPEPDEGAPIDPRESTGVLIARVRQGDERARDRLDRRYRSALRLWAHGRLPMKARDLMDTEDLVQTALARAYRSLDRFEDRRDGAFLAYVRQILLNRIRDEARRVRHAPTHSELTEQIQGEDASPLELAVRRDQLDHYEAALENLNPMQREAIILRLELGFPYREIAESLGLPTGNAARMLTARGLVHLTQILKG